MFLFSNDLGVDLGTSNVLIYADGKGLVVREPSVVAMDKNTGKILQVGAAARNMLGRTPGNVVAMHPLKDGTVSDHEMTVRMLQEMFKTATKASFFTPKPRVVISVPSGVSEVEERQRHQRRHRSRRAQSVPDRGTPRGGTGRGTGHSRPQRPSGGGHRRRHHGHRGAEHERRGRFRLL